MKYRVNLKEKLLLLFMVKDPLTNLNMRCDHLRVLVLPTHHERMHLQFQYFKTAIEYNYILFKITFPLKLCGKIKIMSTC